MAIRQGYILLQARLSRDIILLTKQAYEKFFKTLIHSK